MPEEEDYSDLDSMDLDDIPADKEKPAHSELWGITLNYMFMSRFNCWDILIGVLLTFVCGENVGSSEIEMVICYHWVLFKRAIPYTLRVKLA